MKQCPVCNDELSKAYLESGLPAYNCERCNGVWLSANEYLMWLRIQPPSDCQGEAIDMPLQITDSKQAILCPDCGRILRRYKISPDIEFHLDRCGRCNGVWFDQNEWQALKAQGLHGKVNMFFTEPWQRKLRQEETRRRFERMYCNRFGGEDYAEIKRIKSWLIEHPQRSGLLAYLLDQNPYRG